MFSDRIFSLSIAFSTVWHLFWICVVGIAITPSVRPANLHQEVGFLGPILEKTAFDLLTENVNPQAETLYSSSVLFQDEIYLKPEGPERKVRKEFLPGALSDGFVFFLRDYVNDTREIQPYLAHIAGVKYEGPDHIEAPGIKGPAADRGIIFKPGLPDIPAGLYGDNKEYAVKLKFFVSRKGLVYGVAPVVSSGFPEIDMEATKSLKRWRFSPSSGEKKSESDWGIITVMVKTR